MNQPNPAHSRSSSVASVLLLTRGFLRTQLWVWPLVAALILTLIGIWLRVKMEDATKQQIADMLQTILNANNEALHSWSVTMKADAENLAADDRVRGLVEGLILRTKSSPEIQAALLNGAAAFRPARPPPAHDRAPRPERVCGTGHEFSGVGFGTRFARRHAIAGWLYAIFPG